MAGEKGGLKEKIVGSVKKAMEEVKKTGSPVGIEIVRTENFVFQLLVIPPGTQRYGATTVHRENPAVLPQIRSRKLWRNAITFKEFQYIKEVKELLDAVLGNKEIVDAIKEVMTPRETTKPSLVIEI